MAWSAKERKDREKDEGGGRKRGTHCEVQESAG